MKKKDCLGCWYFLPFKNGVIDIEEMDEGYCLNEKSKYYCDKVVGKGTVCKLWSNTAPREEEK